MVMKMNSNSENVLKALSSTTRRTIMRQISVKGSATYTEIMLVLNLDPSLMSGTFNYHLKELSGAGLIEKTDGEYSITDLGRRALILVDQVVKDVKVDRYGVLAAVMSMNPRTELALFTSQVGLMLGFLAAIFGGIGIALSYERWDFEFLGSSTVMFTGLALFIISTARMVRMIRQYKLGFSSMVFLSLNWFFIRSANRNNFFIVTFLLAGFVVTLALSLLLPYSGVMTIFSLEWYELLASSIVTGLLSCIFFMRALRKANQLEETTREQ